MSDRPVTGAVVFDLDGTLVDSAPDLHAAVNVMLVQMGREALALAQVTSFVGNGVRKLVERSLEATGGMEDEAGLERALELFHAHYGAHPVDLSAPYPGVVEALDALRSAGFRLGICTNKPHELALDVVRRLQLDAFIEVTVGGGFLPVLKPDPAPLRYCLEQLGSASGPSVFVGDSEADEATALAASLPFAFFTGGYRKKAAADFTCAFAFERFGELVPGLNRVFAGKNA